jgi:hypothetical protein
VNGEVNLAIEDCLVDFFFEDSFLVEREERCSLVGITRCRNDFLFNSQTRIPLSNALCN